MPSKLPFKIDHAANMVISFLKGANLIIHDEGVFKQRMERLIFVSLESSDPKYAGLDADTRSTMPVNEPPEIELQEALSNLSHLISNSNEVYRSGVVRAINTARYLIQLRLNALTGSPRKHLEEIQTEVGDWSNKNFGRDYVNTSTIDTDPLLGVVEEVGEIAHAVLKLKQGIRGTHDHHIHEIKDGIGDTLVYLLDFCARNGWSAEEILATTWSVVKQRDWKNNPPS